ncbi:MAG: adenylate kinase [Thermofilum sp.]
MRLVLIGPPGVGKGTYAQAISHQYRIPHISTGDIFREEVKRGSELGRAVKVYLERGLLVPDDIVIEVVKARLSREDCREGFILDGFPRTVQQAEALEAFAPPDLAINFTADDNVIVERLSGRRVCPRCGAIFHVKYMPPRFPGLCDKCGAPLIVRHDDKPEVITERLRVYREQFTPIIEFYEKRRRLVTVVANEQAPQVIPKVIALIEEWRRSRNPS